MQDSVEEKYLWNQIHQSEKMSEHCQKEELKVMSYYHTSYSFLNQFLIEKKKLSGFGFKTVLAGLSTPP